MRKLITLLAAIGCVAGFAIATPASAAIDNVTGYQNCTGGHVEVRIVNKTSQRLLVVQTSIPGTTEASYPPGTVFPGGLVWSASWSGHDLSGTVRLVFYWQGHAEGSDSLTIIPAQDCPPPPEPTCETDASLCPPPPPPTCETDADLCPPPPPVPTCETDQSLCPPPPPVPTCETDQSLCPPPPPVPTCETDESLCPVVPTCETDASLCEGPPPIVDPVIPTDISTPATVSQTLPVGTPETAELAYTGAYDHFLGALGLGLLVIGFIIIRNTRKPKTANA